MNLVDFDTDCHDPNSHVNPSGAWKITDHIGKILRERYGVPDHRGEEGYKYWSEDYSEYYKLKAERLKKIEDLNTYLMLLEDKNYGYLMCVENPLVFQDKVTMNLLRNKGVDITGINEGTRYIYISGTSAAVFTSVDAAKEELSDRAEEDFSADVNQIKITVFDVNDTSKIINTSIFNVPHITDMNERHPDKDGITFFTSRIKRA